MNIWKRTVLLIAYVPFAAPFVLMGFVFSFITGSFKSGQLLDERMSENILKWAKK